MTTSTHLVRRRRFLPLFVTQLLGAFNDNLFKNALVFFVVYSVYDSDKAEANFSALSSFLFILPFFLFSALAGQLADMRDKARLIRFIKLAEIGIMTVGACGLLLAWKGMVVQDVAVPLMLLALFGMGVHSTFFGPIKYAILPQHLHENEVLAGTGLVEAGTYIAILAARSWRAGSGGMGGRRRGRHRAGGLCLQPVGAARPAAGRARAARFPHLPLLGQSGAQHHA
jgi:MFS family permease